MKRKARDIIILLGGLILLFLLNFGGQFLFSRFDLTEEKKYTLTDASKELLTDLEDEIFIRVYLEGSLPSNVRALKNATEQLLEDFKDYGQGNINFEFVNPFEDVTNKKTENEIGRKLVTEKKLQETVMPINQATEKGEMVIFPCATISYQGKELPLNFLKVKYLEPIDDITVNIAINNLEYEFISVFKRITAENKPSIAFIQGNKEIPAPYYRGLLEELGQFYQTTTIELKGNLNSLSFYNKENNVRINKYDAIVIAKPDTAYTEKDKFLIDQFIMRGGKSLWLIDPIHASMDSLRTSKFTLGLGNKVNLDDLLFRYGVRLNKNLLFDQSCFYIDLQVSGGENPKFKRFPWYFHPLILSRSKHPIVSNLDPIFMPFTSTLDTLDADPDVKRTVLLTSSKYSRPLRSPVRIHLNHASMDPDFTNNTKPYKPVSVLLEGKFKSAFENRVLPQIKNEKNIQFKPEGIDTKMIVVSDGDMILDEYSTKYFFANRIFLLNAFNYLLDDKGLISIRSREITIRKLDQQKITTSKTWLKIKNVALPVVCIILLGIAQFFIRKRKFENP